MTDAPPVEIRGLVKRYGELTAVAGVDLTVHAGDVYGYLGPDGAGKTTFMMVDGHSYRVGQVRAFLRIPLGYTQLYGVCTLVGAAAVTQNHDESNMPRGNRWLSATLFGESIGGVFERGVSQYPTIEDEVHLVGPQDMRVIYGATEEKRAITVGHIAAASGISGDLDLRLSDAALCSSRVYWFRKVQPHGSVARSD